MKGRSLESRLCLLVAGLLFALLLAIGHFQLAGQEKLLLEEKTDKFESISKVLSLAYEPLAGQSGDALYRTLTSRLMEADADIEYVVISSADNHVLFVDTRKMPEKDQRYYIGGDTTRLINYVKRLSNTDDGEFGNVTIPSLVGDGKHGSITVGFGSASVAEAMDDIRSRLIATFALAFIVGILGSIILARSMVDPIKRLTEATRAVGDGDLEARVPVLSRDEIGELGETFNRMVQALNESRDKLIQRANTDSLTELYNHKYFQERLASEIKRAHRYGRPLSMIMLDIDHFKTLNDTHGHPFGDIVLQEVARILVSESRDIDVVARYGGEEFSIILPETAMEEGVALADRLRLAVQRHCFATAGGASVPVTISLGVAQYPIHSSEREGLIMAADLAMYQSKSMGRNRVTAFTADIREANTTDPYKLYLLLHAKDLSTIEAMAGAVDAKGGRYHGFSREVMLHCLAVADELGIPESEKNDLKIASLLRDIGKLGISDVILSKEEPLTSEELQILKSHPNLGYAIVQKSPHLKSMLPGILHHHECWDGSGYPNGLKHEEIPMIARIIAVVDAFHAMLVERPYCKASTTNSAKVELQRCVGTQFSPDVTEAFLKVLAREEQVAA